MSKPEHESQNRPDNTEREIVTLGQRFYPYTDPMLTKPLKGNSLPDGIVRYKQVVVPEIGGIAEIMWTPAMYIDNMPTRKFTFRLPPPDFNSAKRYTGRKYGAYLPRGIAEGYVCPEVRLTIPLSEPSGKDIYAFIIENEGKQLVSRFTPSLDQDEERGIVFTGSNVHWQDMEDSPFKINTRSYRWTGQYSKYSVEHGDQLIIPDDPLVLHALQMQIFKV